MRLLTFQASSFSWNAASQTLDDAPTPTHPNGAVQSPCVVAFLHIEEHDCAPEHRTKALRKTLKHIKWVATQRTIRHVVLHSFTHLGGQSAQPSYALAFLNDTQNRLETADYTVAQTPFGFFSSWDIAVLGDSMAKVYRSF